MRGLEPCAALEAFEMLYIWTYRAWRMEFSRVESMVSP
jgi:hypothetical protein